MRRTEHLSGTVDMGYLWRRWQDNIKMISKKQYDNVDWIYMIHDRDHISTTMDIRRVPKGELMGVLTAAR
jgi:hypothetical protein